MYGPVIVREIYGATEGIFGQQRDKNRAWVPNYDLFFFEVRTRSGIKMLHEMRPGGWGRLIVSTRVLPRYDIGDIILAYAPGGGHPTSAASAGTDGGLDLNSVGMSLLLLI